MDHRSHPYRVRPVIHGFSHGLKICSPHHVFAPVCPLVPPFRIYPHPLPIKRPTTIWSVFLLSMGYKKDIFGSFAYEFELLQKMKSLLTQG